MARKVPTPKEFEVKENEVTHKPTGATWTAYSGAPEAHKRQEAMLGIVLRNGDEYRPQEVEEMGRRLLRERLTKK